LKQGTIMADTNNHGVEVLIAEDSPTQAEQLRYLLEEQGFAVTTAANGREALAAARRCAPQVVVSDVMMPELDGYGLCEAIKSDPALKEVPVVLVTALSDPRDVIRGIECGADNFIRKPYDEKYLLSSIDHVLMNRELRKTQKLQVGVEISLLGEKHFITAERQQLLDLLISTYEQAVRINGELKAREQDLAHSNQVLNGLYYIAEGLNRTASGQEVAQTALERAMEVPGIQAGWIALRDGETGFRIAASRNLPPALAAPGWLDGDCLCRRLLLSRKFDAVTNIIACERLSQAAGDTHGLRYHASIPLWAGERALGVMNLLGPGEGAFEEGELQILASVGNQVAVALERARLLEHLENLVDQRTAALTAEIAQRRRAEARIMRLNRVHIILSGINSAIVRLHEREALFAEACRIAVEHGGFRMAWIGELDAAGLEVTPVARAGFDDGYVDDIRLTARENEPDAFPLMAQALRTKAPVVCNDIDADSRVARWRAEALASGYRSLVVFPLRSDGTMAALFLLYAEEPGFFDTEEMKLLTELAADVSFALGYIAKEEQLSYLAYYDALTGLPNRTVFVDRLNQLLPVADTENAAIAVLVLDLDRFRIVNESFGRHAGDALLKQVAERLADAGLDVRHLARISADCFAAVHANLRGESEVVHVVEEQILGSLSRPFVVDGQELRIAARCGIALSPADGADADTLFRNAEAALKKAKLAQERYRFYTPELNARVAEKLSIENKLRRAIELEQFLLHYQPKVDLRDGHICGLEALIRWDDPLTRLVPPLEFIPVLEETGMIYDVGRWALGQAVADARRWHAAGLAPPRVAVNVSALQLRRKDFVDTLGQALGGAHRRDALEIEITESLLMENIEANIAKLRAVREMGVEVAVDDFGTGYSSLSYIAKLPINSLKIDRAFVTNVTSNPDDLHIVSTIVSLAHSLRLRVVAEGVETEEQAKLLRLLKCDEAQGFLFSRAVPAEQVEYLLREGKVWRAT
jgi:diguanylate cyclase (GGDEF)-like protein